MSATPRNLIICCDGTNNLWSAANDVTNIVKIFRLLHQDDTQLCYYDPGVGTASGQLHESSGLKQRLARLAGLAWGNGVWKNVADAYSWLITTIKRAIASSSSASHVAPSPSAPSPASCTGAISPK